MRGLKAEAQVHPPHPQPFSPGVPGEKGARLFFFETVSMATNPDRMRFKDLEPIKFPEEPNFLMKVATSSANFKLDPARRPRSVSALWHLNHLAPTLRCPASCSAALNVRADRKLKISKGPCQHGIPSYLSADENGVRRHCITACIVLPNYVAKNRLRDKIKVRDRS